MSNIEEMRLRLEAAKEQFGLEVEDDPDFSVRLVHMFDAIVDDLWAQRRDNERLDFENKEFRGMLLKLLSTVETRDRDTLRKVMAEIAEQLTAMIDAGAGAPVQDPELEPFAPPGDAAEAEPEPADAPDPAEMEVEPEEIEDAGFDEPAQAEEIEDIAPDEPAPADFAVNEEEAVDLPAPEFAAPEPAAPAEPEPPEPAAEKAAVEPANDAMVEILNTVNELRRTLDDVFEPEAPVAADDAAS